MNKPRIPRNPRVWRAGLDLGTRSVGFAAVEYDSDRPSAILGAMSLIHDSGVLEEKTATTRLAAAGIAKRTRRLIKRRRQRLVALDRHLRNLGWGEPPESTDPYAAWSARAELAERYETDDERRGQQLTLALRHIARHRGWRIPGVELARFTPPRIQVSSSLSSRTESSRPPVIISPTKPPSASSQQLHSRTIQPSLSGPERSEITVAPERWSSSHTSVAN